MNFVSSVLRRLISRAEKAWSLARVKLLPAAVVQILHRARYMAKVRATQPRINIRLLPGYEAPRKFYCLRAVTQLITRA